MKERLFALALLLPTLCWAGPSPVKYTVMIHVRSSRLIGEEGNLQRLSVTIDGKKYKLQTVGAPFNTMLRLGDYKARIAREDASRPYEYLREYEFLFPDGKTRRYTVVGEDE